MSGFTHESTNNESIEWYTPPEIFEGLGVKFDLDPCSPGPGLSFVPATKHYTIQDDGLSQPWEGFVFVNPPYGKQTGTWLNKLAAYDGDGIALVFARTDVQWFQTIAPKLSAICFISGRVRFYQGSTSNRGGTPGAGSMLLAVGEKGKEALIRFAESGLGVCYTTPITKTKTIDNME